MGLFLLKPGQKSDVEYILVLRKIILALTPFKFKRDDPGVECLKCIFYVSSFNTFPTDFFPENLGEDFPISPVRQECFNSHPVRPPVWCSRATGGSKGGAEGGGHSPKIMLGLGNWKVAILPSEIDSFRAKCLSPNTHPAHLKTRMENQQMQPPLASWPTCTRVSQSHTLATMNLKRYKYLFTHRNTHWSKGYM